eukprot:CAMPEP_0170454894 /NCGR_PEP_ID=MMETSP0123-20130129/3001_1 /TAXON_ID=182087 /ORGANISM="Favella ehrenbergii, Strain Fehren 1" /LENGTH=35 /DNA_ID= /DNA_START= /DNA_END= /DNA_ORIENTATION=
MPKAYGKYENIQRIFTVMRAELTVVASNKPANIIV